MLFASMEACDRFKEVASTVMESPCVSFEAVESLAAAAKVLRGKCSGGTAIVEKYIETDIISTVVDICQSITTRQSLKVENSGAESADLAKARKTLVVVMCQLLANFSASGELGRSHLFTINTSESHSFAAFSHILSAAVMSGSRGAVAAFMAMLYNCLQSNGSENAETLQAIRQRCSNISKCRSLLCQILLAVLDNSKTTLNANETKAVGDDVDPALEWFHMLAFVWVRMNVVHSIHTLVGPTTVKAEFRGDILPLTHEQLIILQLVSDVVEDPYFIEILNGNTTIGDSVPRVSATSVFDSTRDVVGSGGMVDFLIGLSNSICALNITAILGSTVADTNAMGTSGEGSATSISDGEGEGDAADRIELQMRRDLTADFLPLALQVLASTLACADKVRGAYLREALATLTGLLAAAVRVLGGRDPSSRARHAKSSGTTGTSTGAPTEAQLERGKVCVRLTLQLLGNLVYGCDVAKDALRETGALAAVLSHCATDFGNPVSREWALLCVRNACDVHIGNQTFIQELRPQEVVIQDEKLKEQGLRVEMNTETGQFKFINTKDAAKETAKDAGKDSVTKDAVAKDSGKDGAVSSGDTNNSITAPEKV